MTNRPTTTWTVRSTDATIAVFEYGNPDADTTVLLVHGYPDDHTMFDPMIEAIGDRARVIAYDTRGGGVTEVDDPGLLASFTLERLAEDAYAVVDSITDLRGRIHVFAHDWGSLQMWEVMASPRAADTFASYVSVSGPSLDHMRGVARLRGVRPTRWPSIVSQVGRSWYIWGFHIPVVGLAVPKVFSAVGGKDTAPTADPHNQRRGIALYRANVLQRMLHGPEPRCAVPTTVVVPQHDRFLSPGLVEGLDEWIPDLTILEVDAKHWWPWTHPRDAADVLLRTTH